MKVFYVSHGGLGNQLFQLFHALLYSRGEIVKYYHDNRYYHGFKCEIPDNKYMEKCCDYERFILSLRIPKILKKIKISNRESLRFAGVSLLDGYFQSIRDYNGYSKNEISIIKHKVKSVFGEWPERKNPYPLYHLRLGDFFASENDQIEYVSKRLKVIPNNSALVSNRDDIFEGSYYVKYCMDNNLKYYQTGKMSAIELVKFMSCFENINSNGSTLAFWAACFGNCEVDLNNQRLQLLFDCFRN